jgi:hypothetical protein
MGQTRKGGIPREMPPDGSDFLKFRFDIQIAASSPRICSAATSRPARPSHFRYYIPCKSFLAATLSFVADSLDDLDSTLFCWKIALPMKWYYSAAGGEMRLSENYALWK